MSVSLWNLDTYHTCTNAPLNAHAVVSTSTRGLNFSLSFLCLRAAMAHVRRGPYNNTNETILILQVHIFLQSLISFSHTLVKKIHIPAIKLYRNRTWAY